MDKYAGYLYADRLHDVDKVSLSSRDPVFRWLTRWPLDCAPVATVKTTNRIYHLHGKHRRRGKYPLIETR